MAALDDHPAEDVAFDVHAAVEALCQQLGHGRLARRRYARDENDRANIEEGHGPTLRTQANRSLAQ